MSKEYDDTNTGVLFKNHKKLTESHPDYTGSITLEDGEHWLSAWNKESRIGVPYIKMSIGKLRDQELSEAPPQAQQTEPLQDQIPF